MPYDLKDNRHVVVRVQSLSYTGVFFENIFYHHCVFIHCITRLNSFHTYMLSGMVDVLFRCVSLFLLDGPGARSFSESLASPSKDGGAFGGVDATQSVLHPPFLVACPSSRGPTRIPLLLLLSSLRVYKLTRFVFCRIHASLRTV